MYKSENASPWSDLWIGKTSVEEDGSRQYNDRDDDDDGSGSEEDSGNASLSDGDEEGSWISWFCQLRGNEFFCEVDEEYIQDDFNLTGLSAEVPYYDYAMDLILDAESPNDDFLTQEQNEVVEMAAEMLYGLIHVRYILTSKGMATMLQKYKNADFGRCPRVYCSGQLCLPIGQSDIPRNSTVKIYCPKCEDIYYPRTKHHGDVDGAYFGTTFAHLLLLSNPNLKQPKPENKYVPRVYGLKIHKSAKMKARADMNYMVQGTTKPRSQRMEEVATKRASYLYNASLPPSSQIIGSVFTGSGEKFTVARSVP